MTQFGRRGLDVTKERPFPQGIIATLIIEKTTIYRLDAGSDWDTEIWNF